MKKILSRFLMLFVAVTLFSFADSKQTESRPIFGSGTQCMPAIHWPNGDCIQECRNVTYIFWVGIPGDWETTNC